MEFFQRESQQSVKKRRLESQTLLPNEIPGDVTMHTGPGRSTEGVYRGLSIKFVEEFCVEFNVWEKPTWWVCENIIKPACVAGGPDGRPCRYVDLPDMVKMGEVGRAKTFVSHAWGAPFGLIVVALLEGEPDMSRLVWIDIFAVLQFDPKPEGELRFDSVISDCSSFLLVVPFVQEIEDMDWRVAQRHDMSGISEDTFRMLPMYRVWCLVEIFVALQLSDMVVMMKVGRLLKCEDSVFGYKLDSAGLRGFLRNLFYLIDVKQAKASVEADRVRILEEHKDKLPTVDAKVRGLCAAAAYGSEDASTVSLVLCAAMGDSGALSRVKLEADVHKRQAYECVCAGRGFTELLRNLLDTYSNEDRVKDLLVTAARGGQVPCVKLLIQYKFNVNTANKDSRTPCMNAAAGGHTECLRHLLEAGADVNAADKDSWTACINAAIGGHTECLRLLLAAGADVNASDDNGETACLWAARGGHTECLRLLLEVGADLNAIDKEGRTALEYARGNEHSDSVTLLESYGAN